MNRPKLLNQKRKRRQARSRAHIRGTNIVPRFAIFRSNRDIYAQLIDDGKSHTIVSASTKEVNTSNKANKTERARLLGELLADKAREAGITKAVFDRRHYRFHGRVKAVADGARAHGLVL